METFVIDSPKEKDLISLNDFVDQIIATYAEPARKQGNRFVNAIPEGFLVHTDGSLLSRVMSGLFNTIMNQCEHCSIRLSAKSFHNVVLVHITNINGIQSIHLSEEIFEMTRIAESLGGCITYNSQHLNESTFTLTFFNHEKFA